MCCLFGLIDYGHQLTGKQKTRMIYALAVQSEERGTDATGYAYNTEGKLRVYKRPLAAHKVRPYIPNDAYVVMGHTRMATQGKAQRNYNNHPFVGEVGGEQFALAHNGVLYNDRRLRKSQRLPDTKIETDSYVAVQLIEKQNALTPDSLKEMAQQVEGSFVFTVLGRDNTLSFVRGDNPLCLYHYPRLGLYLYASTATVLNRAIDRTWLKEEPAQEVWVEPGDILQINALGQRHSSRFEFESYDYFGWGHWFSRYAGEKSSNAQATGYLEELKSIARAFGYTPETVDRMLAHGFTTDEIEEFLYCGEV